MLFALVFSGALSIFSDITLSKPAPELIIFASFSMPNLGELIDQAGNFGGRVVVRGLKNSSMIQTASYLQKILKEKDQGIQIDPEIFKQYEVKQVPAFLLQSKNCADLLKGNVTIRFALEKIESLGDCTLKAKYFLSKVVK